MTKPLLILGVGLAGIYLVMRKKVGTKGPANSATNAGRVDNANQPWYNGIMSWGKSQADNVAKNPTAALQNVGVNVPNVTSIKSLSDVTGMFSGLFGSSNTNSTAAQQSTDPNNTSAGSTGNSNSVGSTDDLPYGGDPSLPASNVNQSNLLGVDTNFDSQLPDPSQTIMADSSDPGTVDYSNPDDYSSSMSA